MEKPTMFSLEWFKSKLKKRVILPVFKNVINDFEYLNIKLIDNCLTVVLKNGKILTKSNSSEKDYLDVLKAKSLNEVKVIMFYTASIDPYLQENKSLSSNDIINYFEVFKTLSDFVVINNTVTLKETGRSLPELLINKFIEIIKEIDEKLVFEDLQNQLNKNSKYQAYKNFFLWCCLNPRAEVSDSLYNFIEKNSFNITKQGFIVALRNVVTVSENTELVNAISSVYHKVKTIWRKHTYKYFMFQNKKTLEYTISLKKDCSDKLALIGNLKELYDNLPKMKENRYTDDYTKTFDIRIGQVVNMPKEDCEWSLADCQKAGLHFCSKAIEYVGCGDQSVIMLINPMKIVGIGDKKGRCYEYLPIMAVSREESTTILQNLDFDTLEIEEDYAVKELENLKEEVKKGFIAEVSKHQFNLPTITTSEISNIVNSLNDMKKSIDNRVQKIK